MPRFATRQCPRCRLRFPVEADSVLGQHCPLCSAPTELEPGSYDTHSAQVHNPGQQAGGTVPPGPRVSALLDNLRSLSNVGSIVRTADGVGLSHLHVCGITPTPEHPRLEKTALGAQKRVPWTHHRDGLAAAAKLRDDGEILWAIEGGPGASSLLCAPQLVPGTSVTLLFGHEVSGLDPRILALCHEQWFIPMLGWKGSLNVSVAFGIACYAVRFGLRQP